MVRPLSNVRKNCIKIRRWFALSVVVFFYQKIKASRVHFSIKIIYAQRNSTNAPQVQNKTTSIFPIFCMSAFDDHKALIIIFILLWALKLLPSMILEKIAKIYPETRVSEFLSIQVK